MSKLYNIFKLGASKIKPKTKPDKSKLDLIKSETNKNDKNYLWWTGMCQNTGVRVKL